MKQINELKAPGYQSIRVTLTSLEPYVDQLKSLSEACTKPSRGSIEAKPIEYEIAGVSFKALHIMQVTYEIGEPSYVEIQYYRQVGVTK